MVSAVSSPEPIPQWTLGDRLRKARQFANVSTEEMATDIGRTVHTISNYERDFTRAPLLVLRQYAMRCNVPLEWLQTGEVAESTVEQAVTIGYPDIPWRRIAA